MKRLISLLVLGWTGTLLVVAPVEGADREQQQILAELRMLQEQFARMQQTIIMRDEATREFLQTVLSRLDTEADESRRAAADQKLLIDNLSSAVRIVREKVDETNVRVATLAQEVEALRSEIPKMRTPLTRLAVDPETGLPTDAAAASTPAVAQVNPGASPSQMWDTAWSDYAAGNWSLSIQGFEVYLSAFPRAEQADDAQFYIGENYYAEGKFREAADAYEQVLLRYADGNVVPDTLYKRGLALSRLGEPELARLSFEQVVTNHPEGNVANLAQQMLDRMAVEP